MYSNEVPKQKQQAHSQAQPINSSTKHSSTKHSSTKHSSTKHSTKWPDHPGCATHAAGSTHPSATTPCASDAEKSVLSARAEWKGTASGVRRTTCPLSPMVFRGACRVRITMGGIFLVVGHPSKTVVVMRGGRGRGYVRAETVLVAEEEGCSFLKCDMVS
jgi:hypothetical protein